ncbi:hypothetical protein [Paenibacillus agilis]|uniref:DUF1129 domain-containing protein n=1 Tax=Paenibacillus agilis TaxID=3020863 RepID=A0A559IZX2_9BACL|nr:hypothetical protein [Paenibacillus agilis]TVX93172.1 hypothetical protein FPZ44_08935 [Paenibacillus agilis]
MMEAIERYLERLSQRLGSSEESSSLILRTKKQLYTLSRDYTIRGYSVEESAAKAIEMIQCDPILRERTSSKQRAPLWALIVTFIGFNIVLFLVFHGHFGLTSYLLPLISAVPIPWLVLLLMLTGWSCLLTVVAHSWRKHHAYVALFSSAIIAYISFIFSLYIIVVINIIMSVYLLRKYRTWQPAAIAILMQATHDLTVRLFLWVNLETNQFIPVPDLSLQYILQYSFLVWIVPIVLLLMLYAVYKRIFPAYGE